MWTLTLPVAGMLAIYAVEVGAGLRAARRGAVQPGRQKVAVLIPAHNEELVIGQTLDMLMKADDPADRILVVADNCSDGTSALALARGAECVTRTDDQRRGKSHALAFGRLALTDDPPDVVIVLDADCRLVDGSISALSAAARYGQAAQAINLLEPDLTAPPLVQISNFAFLVKNLCRGTGLQRIGGCGLLTGTGMAFSWGGFCKLELGVDNLAEDLGLTIDLVSGKTPPRLVASAHVFSPGAAMSVALDQRKRWEQGFLFNATRQAIPLLCKGIGAGNRAMVALGLHLLVPPLALLFAIASLCLVLTAGLAMLNGFWLPFSVLVLLIALASVLTLAAWLKHGRTTLSAATLMRIPAYVLWKLPLYIGVTRGWETRWQKTPRG